MQALFDTFAHRPYVLAVVAVFWVVAPRDVGGRAAGVLILGFCPHGSTWWSIP